MARKSRKCIETIYYHVMIQGHNKENIFKNNAYKEKYKMLCLEYSEKNQIIILAYCVMDNHVHLLLKSELSDNLSKMMSQVNTRYGKYYNKVNRRTGYVFRDRYRAEGIYSQKHLQNCIRYIHENPVKARLVKCCSEYKYSSFSDYKNSYVKEEIIKEIFGDEEYILKISGEFENYKFIGEDDEFGNGKEMFEDVCSEYANYDYKNEINVYEISKILKNRTGAENEKIMNFMGVKRATYYNIMKRMKGRLLMDVPESTDSK